MRTIKITTVEKIFLGLTCSFLLVTGGYFLGARSASEPYRVEVAYQPTQETSQVIVQSTPAPDSYNINTASALELDQLPGIGPSRAADIVAYREEHGAFQIVEELTNVPGIGEATLAQLLPYITVS